MLSTVAVHPHRRRAANGDGHDEQIQERDHGEQAGQRAKLHIGYFPRAQGGAHFFKRHLMVIERVVAVLNSQHPGAEQEPQHGRYRLADTGHEIQNKQHNCAGKVPGKLLPFAFHDAREIFHDPHYARIRRCRTGEPCFELFCQQAVKRCGYPVRNRREEIAKHQQHGDHRHRPEKVVKPLQPVWHVTHQRRDPALELCEQPPERAAHQHNVDEQGQYDKAANTR